MNRVLAIFAGALLSGCAVTPPAISTAPDDPSNPAAAEAATRPLRPGLFTGGQKSHPGSGEAAAHQ
jgi:hypothetical protein